jgi:hypothetical protein
VIHLGSVGAVLRSAGSARCDDTVFELGRRRQKHLHQTILLVSSTASATRGIMHLRFLELAGHRRVGATNA